MLSKALHKGIATADCRGSSNVGKSLGSSNADMLHALQIAVALVMSANLFALETVKWTHGCINPDCKRKLMAKKDICQGKGLSGADAAVRSCGRDHGRDVEFARAQVASQSVVSVWQHTLVG